MDKLLQQLPEVIEQIGRDVKAITVVLGKGRPDKPDTTGDKTAGEEPKIKGNEPNGTIYESSDLKPRGIPLVPITSTLPGCLGRYPFSVLPK